MPRGCQRKPAQNIQDSDTAERVPIAWHRIESPEKEKNTDSAPVPSTQTTITDAQTE
jgi:hypothetical protein